MGGMLHILLAILHASTYTVLAQATFPQTKSGNYRIANCGPNAPLLSTLLQSLWSAIEPAIHDAELAPPSPAFSTFFSDVNASYVTAVLTNVTTGVALDSQGSPAFFCPTAGGQIPFIDRVTGERSDVYTKCRRNPKSMMVVMHGTPFIIVCPQFFTVGLRAQPELGVCPQLNRFKSKFEGNGEAVVAYQMWILLEEIVHYYVYMTTQRELDIYDIRACARLNGKDASQNPHNYLFYVASMFSSLSSLDIRRVNGALKGLYGNCTDFPPLPTSRPDERELLGGFDDTNYTIQADVIEDASFEDASFDDASFEIADARTVNT